MKKLKIALLGAVAILMASTGMLVAQGCAKLCGYSRSYATDRFSTACPDLRCRVTNCSGPSIGYCPYGVFCHDPEGWNYLTDNCAMEYCPCDIIG